MAAATLYKRYLWLVDLIYNAKTITREDIDRAWARSTYTIPEDFDAQEYFRNYYGICRNEYTSQPQRLVLEVLK